MFPFRVHARRAWGPIYVYVCQFSGFPVQVTGPSQVPDSSGDPGLAEVGLGGQRRLLLIAHDPQFLTEELCSIVHTVTGLSPKIWHRLLNGLLQFEARSSISPGLPIIKTL